MTKLNAQDILEYLDGSLSPEAHARMTTALLSDPERASFVLDFISSTGPSTDVDLPIDTAAARLQMEQT